MRCRSPFIRILIIFIVTVLISVAETQYKPYIPKTSTAESLQSFFNALDNPSTVESYLPSFSSQTLYPSRETTTENYIKPVINNKAPSDIFPPPSATVFAGTSSSSFSSANTDSSSATYVPPSTRYVPYTETLVTNKAPSDLFLPLSDTNFAGKSSTASSKANTASSSANFVPSRASYRPSNNAKSKESSVLPYAYASSIAKYVSNLNSIKNTSDYVLPPLVETFSNSLSKAVLTIPTIQKFLNIKIPGSKAFTLFLNVSNNILKDYGKQIPVLPKWLSQSNKDQGLLTLPLFFEATGNAITKFLISQGIKIVPDITGSTFADSIEKVVNIANLTNTETLYKAITEIYIDLLKSFGINIGEHSDSIAELLQNEMKNIQNYV